MRYGLVALAACASLALAACGGEAEPSGKTIAFLLPENDTVRYERSDRPRFERAVERRCPDCTVVYANAGGDAAKQQQQAQDAVTQGADVLVLDPVDGRAAAPVVDAAHAKHVPVISYDRLLMGSEPDYQVGFDSPSIGGLQGRSLVGGLKQDGRSGSIVMLNGAADDANAKVYKRAAHAVIDPSAYRVAREYDTPGWQPAAAKSEMAETIAVLGKDGFAGVYAADDGIAGGAIAALEDAGIDPRTIPVTGQGAELAAIQRVVAGRQHMTVYRPVAPLAERAAEWAVALADGDEPSDRTFKVPVTSVTAGTVADTVVKDGYWKADEICTPDYAAACEEHGIS
jgi:D-xylose transport system substrate-binding protein